MFASMCTLMVLNVMFVKMLLSAMSHSPTGVVIVPWVMLITGIVRMAQKMDSIILRIGLNPAMTGDPLGRHHIPGLLSAMMFHHAASFIKNTMASTPPHATNTAQPHYDSPLAYGMARQVTTGRTAEIGAPAGNSAQSHEAEHCSETHNNTNTSSSGRAGMPQRTASACAPHQYADINIEADDFIDGESISHIGSTVTAVSSRISPITPRTQPLPHDFAETKPLISSQTARPPVTPQAQHTNSTTQTAQNAPQNIVQNANSQNIAESQLAEHSMEQTSASQPQTIEHSTQTENNSGTHGQQAGRISPITPPCPAMAREFQKTEQNTAAHSSTQRQSANDKKAIHHVQSQTADKSAFIMPNVSQASPTENIRASAPAQKAVPPAAQEHKNQRASAQAVRTDIKPQRNRGTSSAVRPDISPVATQNPAVKPQQGQTKSPNPVSRVTPASQPHTLRRTAEPVKRKDVMPRNGGDRNARRKRKP